MMAERPKKILIVGGGAGGMAATERLRQLSAEFDITIIDRSLKPVSCAGDLSEHRGVPIKSSGNSTDRFAETFEKHNRSQILLQHEVIRIDRVAKQLTIRDLIKNTKTTLAYDRLILCTGASPIRPHIDGVHSNLVKTVRTPNEVDDLIQLVERRNPKLNRRPIVVLGGTPTGLTVVKAFRTRGMPVALLDAANQVLVGADHEMLAPLHRTLLKHDVLLYLGVSLSKFVQKSEDEIVLELSDSRTISARFVVLAAGFRPEVSLALDAGLESGITGGIRVNDRMQTDDPDIYAIGTAAEISIPCGEKSVPIRLSQLGAVRRQAQVAADHLHGFRHLPFESGGGTSLCRVFETIFSQTGFSEKQLRREHISYEKIFVRILKDPSDPNSPEISRLKVLFSPNDGKLYGAEAVGEKSVKRQIDILASVLRFGGNARQLCDLELGFPSFRLEPRLQNTGSLCGSSDKSNDFLAGIETNQSSGESPMPNDPIQLVGKIAGDLLDGLLRNTARKESKRMKSDQVLLDLRSDDDFEKGTIPDAVSMPLNILETKLDALDKKKEYLLCGYDGLDGYFACRLLMQNGLRAKNFPGGFFAYQDMTGSILHEKQTVETHETNTGTNLTESKHAT